MLRLFAVLFIALVPSFAWSLGTTARPDEIVDINDSIYFGAHYFPATYSIRVLNEGHWPLATQPAITLVNGGRLTGPISDSKIATLNTQGLKHGLYILEITTTPSSSSGPNPYTQEHILRVDSTLSPGFSKYRTPSNLNSYDSVSLTLVKSGSNSHIATLTDRSLAVIDSLGSILPGWPKQIFSRQEMDSKLVVTDIDGDGKSEIFAQGTDSDLKGLDQLGNALPGFPSSGTGFIFTAGSLFGDGKKNLIARWSNKIYVLDDHGNLLPGWPYDIPDARANNGLFSIGNIDNSGKKYIVFVASLTYLTANETYQLHALSPEGVEKPGFPITIQNPWPASGSRVARTTNVVLADADRDGVLEIFFGTSGGRIFGLRGNGSALPGWPLHPNNGLSSVLVADLNQDGNNEAVIGSNDVAYSIYHMDGTKSYEWPTIENTIGPLTGGSGPILVDTDGDGVAEIVFNLDYNSEGVIHALKWGGRESKGFPKPFEPHLILAAGDLDGDKKQELVGLNGNLFVWKLSGKYAPWPMVQNDAGNSGAQEVEAPTTPPSTRVLLHTPIAGSVISGTVPVWLRTKGKINNIQLYLESTNGSQLLTTLHGSYTYHLNTTSLEDGKANLKVRVTPAAGPAYEFHHPIMIDNTAHATIQFNKPKPNEVLLSKMTSVEIKASALKSANNLKLGYIEKVELYRESANGDVLLGTQHTFPYNFSFDSSQTNGQIILKAKAYHSSGTVHIASLPVITFNSRVYVGFKQPLQNSVVTGKVPLEIEVIPRTGSSLEPLVVDLSKGDGTTWNGFTTLTTPPYRYVLDTSNFKNNQMFSIKAFARSTATQSQGIFGTGQVDLKEGNNPPRVSMVRPKEGRNSPTILIGKVTFAMQCVDDDLTKVEFYWTPHNRSKILLKTFPVTNSTARMFIYSTWRLPRGFGPGLFETVAYDKAGQKTTFQRSFIR